MTRLLLGAVLAVNGLLLLLWPQVCEVIATYR
jgi:hypothetical protein